MPKDTARFNKDLQFQAKVPAFLARLQSQYGGTVGGSRGPVGDDDDSPQIVGEDPYGEAGRKRRRVDQGEEVMDRSTGGRAPLPSRPSEGEWAEPSGSSGKRKAAYDDEGEDEWTRKYGGAPGAAGDEDGPQIVVLNEGKHLTQEEVREARANGAFANGGKKVKPSSDMTKAKEDSIDFADLVASHPVSNPKNEKHGSKPKQAAVSGKADSQDKLGKPKKASEMTKKEKKKEREKKGLLSFGEGEE